jgi:type I restriction enzyme S subunit
LRTTNVQKTLRWDDVYYVPREYVKREDQFVQVGDILMSMANSYELVGKVALATVVPEATAFGAFVSAVRPTALTKSPYLFHLLRTQAVQLALREGSSQTTNIANISVSRLSEIEVPLAPLDEQQRISNKLDTVLARVDACRERLDRVAPLLKRFRQAVLTAATAGRLTKDLRGDGNAGWAIMRADDVCAKVQSGGTPTSGFTETTGIPFLKVYNIVDQRIDFECRPQFVHPEVHAGELGKSRALPGDVLMNIVGPPLGKVAVLTDAAPEWNINQAITLFRPSDRITSGWLYILLCEGAAVRSVLDRTKGSVGQVNISLSQCRAFEFPVPTIEEQRQVVRRVEILFAFADRMEARLARAQTAVDRLTPSLLAKAFRGELVPQDPADEPAAALLASLHQSHQRLAATTVVKRSGGRPKKTA